MRRLLLVLTVSASAAFALLTAARGQDGGQGTKADTAATGTGTLAVPDPCQAPVVGERLADGTVNRANLFPLDDGRQWSYQLRIWLTPQNGDESPPELKAPRSYTEEVEVKPAQQIGTKSARCLAWTLGGEQSQLSFYFLDGNTISCPRRILGPPGERQHSFDLDPPQAVLDATKLGCGETWTWTGKVGPTQGELHFTVLRDESITTPKGKFDTVVIQSKFTGNDDSTGCSTNWLAPDVGIVRELTQVKADQQLYVTEAVLTDYKK